MNRVFSSLVLLSLPYTLLAQGWHWQNPLPLGNTLDGVHVFNKDTLVAVGEAGTILKTTDGGITWTSQTSGTTNALHSVYFADPNTGVAVGDSGTILHTGDGGTNWTIQTSGTTNQLSSVFLTDPGTSWAAGDSGIILNTINGGTSWTSQPSGTTNSLKSIFFANPNTGLAVGDSGAIHHTTDGGTTWTSQVSGTTNQLSSIFLTDSNTGWAAGDSGTILHTINGGTSWTPQTSGTTSYLYSVFFTDSSTGWAVGDSATILHTINGGISWAPQIGGEPVPLSSVFFADSSTGWAVGHGGVILHTIDGGTNWTPQTIGSRRWLFSIFFTDSSRGWASGMIGTILHTTNGGTDWTSQSSGTLWNLSSVFFTDPSTGWVVGDNGTIRHTTNGGTTWTPQTSGSIDNLHSVSFTDPNTGWAVGQFGFIFHTTNGGMTWNTQTSGTTDNLYSVFFIDASEGWATGELGVILHTTNGGIFWTSQTSGTTNTLYSIFFADPSKGWAAGEGGTIRHTTNGGITWSSQTSRTTRQLESVFFTGASRGWAVGARGTILHTTNAGTDWVSQNSRTTNDLFDLVFTDPSKGWTAGELGTILHTTTGGTGVEPPRFAPVLLVPADGATAVSLNPTLTWITSPGAELYTLQFSETSDFSALIVDEENLVATSFDITGLSTGTTYYWRVAAQNAGGTGPWSDVWSFTTLTLPAQTVLLSPSDEAVILSDGVACLWREGSPVVDHYWFEYGTDSSFALSTIDSLVTDTVATARNLAHHETYYWRVRAHNEAGWGPFGEVRSFLVLTREPLAPLQVSPPESAINQPLTMTFMWRTVSSVLLNQMKETVITKRRAALLIDSPLATDTVWYHLQLATGPEFTDLLVNDSTLVDTTDVVSSLSIDQTYYWRVRARNLFGASPWSDVWNFATVALPAQVALLSPADGEVVLSDSVACLWRESSPVVDRYWFEYGADSTFAVSTIDSLLTDTVTTVHNLAHHTTYYWRTRAHNEAGWGSFSEVRNFLVLTREPLVPLQVSPTDGAINRPLTITFVWRTVSSALLSQMVKEEKDTTKRRNTFLSDNPPLMTDTVWYHLQLATDPGFTDLLVSDSTLVDTTERVSSLSGDVTYYWRIRARNLIGASPWSDVRDFTTITLPGHVALLSPFDEAVILGDSVACIWREGSPLVDRYWFEYGTDSSFSLSTIDSMVTDIVTTVHNLTQQVQYFWRVKAHNLIGWGEFSEVWSFSVLLTGVEDEEEVPVVYSLHQNYPNPFNPSTTIRYGLPERSHVSLEVYNMVGQRVATLIDGEQQAGWHEVVFEDNTLASGLYIYRLTAGEFVDTRKLVLLK